MNRAPVFMVPDHTEAFKNVLLNFEVTFSRSPRQYGEGRNGGDMGGRDIHAYTLEH